MRLWLALVALLALLLTPVAASAAAPVCLQHAQPAMTAGMAQAGAHHGCCPDSGKPKPAKPDRMACADACALMCASLAALPAAAPVLVKPERAARLAVLPPGGAEPHPPSLPERPPRHLA